MSDGSPKFSEVFANAPFNTPRIGDILLQSGCIKPPDIGKAEKYARDNNCKFGDALVGCGACTAEDIAKVFAEQASLPYVDPEQKGEIVVDDVACKQLTLDVCNELGLVIIQDNQALISNPYDITYRNVLADTFGARTFEVKVASTTTIRSLVERMLTNMAVSKTNFSDRQISDMREKVQSLIEQAASRGVSDIHVKPMPDKSVIQFRQNGMLDDAVTLSPEEYAAFIVVVKSVFNMDIAKHNVVEDGRGSIQLPNLGKVDLRASSIPTRFGESIVLRLLVKRQEGGDLAKLGVSKRNLNMILQILNERDGLFIVTGPTGSGKTTTIYGGLGYLHQTREGESIQTIEDPIEYFIPYARQFQVDDARVDASGAKPLGFERILEGVLRHDPDIVLIGEMRSKVTAHLGVTAALTGHYVISTLHTRNAISAIVRLEDMGVSRNLIGETVVGLSAQRLVRGVCQNPKCHEVRGFTEDERKRIEARQKMNDGNKDWLDEYIMAMLESKELRFAGKGCDRCRKGFAGREVVMEVFRMTDRMRHMLLEEQTVGVLASAAVESGGYRPLVCDMMEKVREGRIHPMDVLKFLG